MQGLADAIEAGREVGVARPVAGLEGLQLRLEPAQLLDHARHRVGRSLARGADHGLLGQPVQRAEQALPAGAQRVAIDAVAAQREDVETVAQLLHLVVGQERHAQIGAGIAQRGLVLLGGAIEAQHQAGGEDDHRARQQEVAADLAWLARRRRGGGRSVAKPGRPLLENHRDLK